MEVIQPPFKPLALRAATARRRQQLLYANCQDSAAVMVGAAPGLAHVLGNRIQALAGSFSCAFGFRTASVRSAAAKAIVLIT